MEEMKMITYDKDAMLQATKTEGEDYSKMREQYYELKKFIGELEGVRQEQIKEWHKKKMQSLKQGTTVYCGRNNTEIPYGSELRKVGNGSKYMKVVFNAKHWDIPYSWVTTRQPEKSDIETNRRIAKIFSDIKT